MKHSFLCIFYSLFLCVPFSTTLTAQEAPPKALTVGSKIFTESVILGEILRQGALASGLEAQHHKQLGGTQFLWKALLRGDIDAYPEYTGTIEKEILHHQKIDTMANALSKHGINITQPLGFNNTYALCMKRDKAHQLGIKTISDLTHHPELTFGFSNEFMERNDGWPGLRATYHLPQDNVKGMDHNLSYQGIDSDVIDVMDGYSTDAEILFYDLMVLEDDRHFFPRYDAVILYRDGIDSKTAQQFEALGGTITESKMVELNHLSKIKRLDEEVIAAHFFQDTFGQHSQISPSSLYQDMLIFTRDHLTLVLISLSAAILVSVPLGILAAQVKWFASIILSLVGVLQTIPSLALLVFMIPLLGIGAQPAIMALFLYSLLPIVRNTYTGLVGIPHHLKESAEALGLSRATRLWRIEIPLALPTILAGIKTSAVINVGTATLGALIGAGGFGQPILTGIRLDDRGLILQGAIPAALLALVAQGFFEWIEKHLVAEGLRLKRH